MKEGIVVKNTGSWYSVKSNDTIIQCRIKGKLRMKGLRSTNPVAVGDNVVIDYDEKEGVGVVKEIKSRRNHFTRRSINLSKASHVIAANIDRAILIATVNFPETSTTFIDRFLVTAEAYDIPATIVFNKVDRYNAKDKQKLAELIALYEGIGYACLSVSAKDKINTDVFSELLKDKVTLLSGHSGVGKSTLINAVYPDLELKTSEISDYHKAGKHTTTFSEMFDLPFGGQIIDTPGIKGLGTLDFEKEEVYHFFPEFFKLSGECKFYNCTHLHEPGCVISEALQAGDIAVSRYNSYLSILTDNTEEKYR
ncbi:MAG: ribosome small subunit-dependent GTPase A [Bacteroidales bacterium]|nr:ribosome small subunit-dependent GTPase A [Bacteroidales bacterium]